MTDITSLQNFGEHSLQQARGVKQLSSLQAAFHQAKKGAENGSEGPLRKAAEDFESVFLSQMLAPMFSGLKSDGPLGGGHAEEVFRSMLVDEFGNAIAESGGIGVAESVYRQLLEIQEASR